jgi:ABC-2 type transport system permease protein
MFSLPVFLSYGIIYQQSFSYYLLLILSIIPFFVICGTIGIGVAIGLVKIFPAKRLKNVLFIISLLFIIIAYFMFRFLKPERLVDPDNFFTVIDYLSALEAPTSAFLPSQWVTDVLSGMLFDNAAGSTHFNMLLLWSTALAFIVMLGWLFNAVFYDSWNKTQEGSTAAISTNRIFNKVFNFMLAPLPSSARSIVEKDIRVFFRDTSQWSQLFILFAIIVIYLYNISVLPMDKNPMPTLYLQNIISFINLGLAGFVISAVAVRFAYPAVSLEGDSFWIIKSSPIGLKGFLWCKFWINFIFLVIMSEILIVFTNYLLKVDTMMMVVSIVTIFLMTLGITSLGIGCGAMYPRFKVENIAQIPTGFGGLLFMILSMLFIGLIIVLEARPVYYFMMSDFSNTPVSASNWINIAIHFGLVLIINILVFIIPMKIGLKKLSEFEKL